MISAKIKFLFQNGQKILCLLYVDINKTFKFNEYRRLRFLIILNAPKTVLKLTEVGTVTENVWNLNDNHFSETQR